MFKRFLVTFGVMFLAVGFLLISLLRTASVRFESNSTLSNNNSLTNILGDKTTQVDYQLASPGPVLPDSPLWPLKAIRDRIWYAIVSDPGKKADLYLLFADKRLGASAILFGQGKDDIAYSTLTKAEKYLELALSKEEENRTNGVDTSEYLQRIAKASLKHYQVLQDIYSSASEKYKPQVIQEEEYPKKVFESARNTLLDKGITPPENPFDWK